MNFTYRKATEADRDRYIDLANLVFSMAHRPHDFKQLLPKVYGDGRETAHMQNIALDDAGNVRGLVAVVHALFAGLPVAEVGRVDAAAELRRLGLEDHLSAQRSNGLRAMVARIRDHAAAAAA